MNDRVVVTNRVARSAERTESGRSGVAEMVDHVFRPQVASLLSAHRGAEAEGGVDADDGEMRTAVASCDGGRDGLEHARSVWRDVGNPARPYLESKGQTETCSAITVQ